MATALLLAATAFADDLPVPGEPRATQFAQPREHTLANGLRVIVVDRPAQPLVTAGLVAKSGSEADPAKLAGLAHFTAGLLARGTNSRPAMQVAQELEELGAELKSESRWDGTLLVMSTLAPTAGRAFEIFADVACHPKFAADEIERLRKERIDEVTVDLEQPANFARAAAARLILGADAYGHPIKGTPASLSRIKRADVLAHYHAAFRPENVVLIIAGDVRAESGFALAETAFGAWGAEMAPAVASAAKAARPKPTAVLIDMPDAGQAAVYIGRAASPRASDDYFTAQIANAVLGGGYSARLNREVRIKRGLSYGCGSRLHAWRAAGIFGAACQTKNESAAEVVRVIHAEMTRLGAGPIPADELTARRLVLTGAFTRDLGTNGGYVERIADFVLHGQPPDAFAATLDRFNRVTGDEVKSFASTKLAPDAMSVIVVGRAKDCEKPLRAIFPDLRVLPQAKVDLDSATLMR
ncbi:MAG: pitrilysin family protein [Chthoniobacteraceae bacterium]